MKDKILEVLAIIGGIFSAIFYVLFLQKKDENAALKKENETVKKESEETDKINKALNETAKTNLEETKKNEELKKQIHSNNANESYSAISNLLR